MSQERNVSPTAMRLSLNDFVTLLRTCSAPATAFYQHAKSLLNVIVKCCSMLYTVVYTPPLFVHFDDYFSKWTCVSQYQNVFVVDFIGAKDDGGGGDSSAIRWAKLQSNDHHQQTNTQLFTVQTPFLSPNQQCQSKTSCNDGKPNKCDISSARITTNKNDTLCM